MPQKEETTLKEIDFTNAIGDWDVKLNIETGTEQVTNDVDS